MTENVNAYSMSMHDIPFIIFKIKLPNLSITLLLHDRYVIIGTYGLIR